jgi:hypothetical protein
MTRKTNTALIALLGTILMGLSTWAANYNYRITNNRCNVTARIIKFR